jgi:hypothetical protein
MMLALVDEIVGGRERSEVGHYDTHRSLFQPSILTDRRAIDRSRGAQNRTACAMARWGAWLDRSSFLAGYIRFALIGTEIHSPRKTLATHHEPCARL